MASRSRSRSSNRAVTIYYNGSLANGFYRLSERVGRTVGRFGVAEERARAGLARRMIPAASRHIRGVFNVRRDRLAGAMRVQPYRRKDSDGLSIWASARRIPLIEFGGQWRGPARRRNGSFAPPATAMVVKGQRESYAGAFINTIQGRRHIRVRTYGPNGRRVGRGPVRPLYGPSPLYMLRPTEHQSAVSRGAMTTAERTMQELQDWYVNELFRLYRVAMRT